MKKCYLLAINKYDPIYSSIYEYYENIEKNYGKILFN
jgi:hypothetical protein